MLQVSPNPAPYGKPVTFSLSITLPGASSPAPSGVVSFSIDDIPTTTVLVTGLNLSTIDSSTASLSVGTHAIVASYSGDANYSASSFGAELQIASDLFPTTTTLVAARTQLAASQTLRLTATVTSPGQNINSPNTLSGTVTFKDGANNLGTSMVGAGGIAIFDTALLAMGTHNLTATYLGYNAVAQQTGSFQPSTSSIISVVVTAAPTTTGLTAQPLQVAPGAFTSLTATVASNGGVPTGAVTFLDGNSILSIQPLDAKGSAAFSVSFAAVATHSLTASYRANSTFAASNSAPLNFTVSNTANAAPSNVQLSALVTESSNQVLLTASVSAGYRVPTGRVVFFDGTVRLGEIPLSSQAIATYSWQSATSGLHYLSAYYSGDAYLSPSSSPALLETSPFRTPDFSLNVSAGSVSLRPGASSALAASVTPINGFARVVALSCNSSTPGLKCRFMNSSLPNGRGTSTLVVTVAQARNAVTRPSSIDWKIQRCYLATTLLSLMMLLALIPGRRRQSLVLVSAMLLVLAAGCGTTAFSPAKTSTPAGTYILTVAAVSSGTDSRVQISHSLPVEVKVEP